MKDKLTDLNDHLFEEIERLGDYDLTDEKLIQEIGRARAITGVAAQIIANGQLVLDAMKLGDELPGVEKYPLLANPKRGKNA